MLCVALTAQFESTAGMPLTRHAMLADIAVSVEFSITPSGKLI